MVNDERRMNLNIILLWIIFLRFSKQNECPSNKINLYCCVGYYRNRTTRICDECPIGYFGVNCNTTCDGNSYGKDCRDFCSCTGQQLPSFELKDTKINMQQEHKNSLQRNYVQLVRETPVEAIVNHLYQNEVITDEQREEILQNTNSYSKARQLIAILQRRGPNAFESFCSALIKEGKSNLVYLLKKRENISQSKKRYMLPIGEDLFVVVNEWRDEVLIHIRKYTKNSADEYTPTKKGIALNLTQWGILQLYVNEIDAAIGLMIDNTTDTPEMTFHLGKGVYVTVKTDYPTVDVRKRWLPPDSTEAVPTKKGISLVYDKWESLKDVFSKVREVVPELEDHEPCILSESHQNHEGMLQCGNCNPFGEPL